MCVPARYQVALSKEERERRICTLDVIVVISLYVYSHCLFQVEIIYFQIDAKNNLAWGAHTTYYKKKKNYSVFVAGITNQIAGSKEQAHLMRFKSVYIR